MKRPFARPFRVVLVDDVGRVFRCPSFGSISRARKYARHELTIRPEMRYAKIWERGIDAPATVVERSEVTS